MASSVSQSIVPAETIERRIFLIRGHKVMLSGDLAILYGVEPRVLIQAVKRNQDRFPADFMFQLSDEEFSNLKSQIVISSWGGLRRANPYAFTEQGVAMLSSVLRSKKAVQVNIAIMRAFVKLRELLATHKDLAAKIEALERKYEEHDATIAQVFAAIKALMAPEPVPPSQRIGFRDRSEDKPENRQGEKHDDGIWTQ